MYRSGVVHRPGCDANIDFGDPQGFLCLRVLLPLLAMGLCILSELKKK